MDEAKETDRSSEYLSDDGTILPPSDYVRWSHLNSFHQCPKQYELLYIQGAPREPQGAFIGGHVVHKTIEWAERQNIWKREDARTLLAEYAARDFAEQVTYAGGPDKIRWAGRKTKLYPMGEDFKWWAFHVRVFSERWLDIRRAWNFEGIKLLPRGAEMAFLASLPNTVPLRGRLDAFMYVDPDGGPLVVDYKTGQRGKSSIIQLATYAWGVGQTRGIEITRGLFVYLRGSHVEIHDLSKFLPIIPGMYVDLVKARDAAAKADVYPMQPSNFCISCQVRMSCDYGKLLEPKEARE